jgi:hypothetical protein
MFPHSEDSSQNYSCQILLSGDNTRSKSKCSFNTDNTSDSEDTMKSGLTSSGKESWGPYRPISSSRQVKAPALFPRQQLGERSSVGGSTKYRRKFPGGDHGGDRGWARVFSLRVVTSTAATILTARSDPCDGVCLSRGSVAAGRRRFCHVGAFPLGADGWQFVQDTLAFACQEGRP